MKDRMTMGFGADAAETAALTIPDERATERIVEAVDWEQDEQCRKSLIDKAVRRLKKCDRAFAKAVLRGASWRDMGISRQAFWKRLKKMEIFFRRVNKGPSRLLAGC